MSHLRPLKVYVAGAFAMKNDIKKIVADLIKVPRGSDERQWIGPPSAAFEIVSDWYNREHVEKNAQTLIEDAVKDINQVSSADVVFAVMTDHEYAYRGTFTEIGCALGQNKPVVVWCDGAWSVDTDDGGDGALHFTHYCQSNVFFHHTNVTVCDTLEMAFHVLQRMQNQPN